MKAKSIYQIKVTLKDSTPPIWRRLLISSNASLSDIHEYIQISMGWTNTHLHQFISGSDYYMPCEDDEGIEGFETLDESKFSISDLLKKPKSKLVYEYDFGDSWQHEILLEKTLPFDENTSLPHCITGKRACPPEDCGGFWGYQNLLESLSDPNHPQHQDNLDWLGSQFDPKAIDITSINKYLKNPKSYIEAISY